VILVALFCSLLLELAARRRIGVAASAGGAT
jgi:hypothetical protein